MLETEGFRGWAIIEQMGHRKLAGYVTEVNLGGARLLQIDVPAIPATPGIADEIPGFTNFIGGQAVYSMAPVTEQVARDYVAQHQPKPFETYDYQQLVRGAAQRELHRLQRESLPAPTPAEAATDVGDDEDDEEYDDSDEIPFSDAVPDLRVL